MYDNDTKMPNYVTLLRLSLLCCSGCVLSTNLFKTEDKEKTEKGRRVDNNNESL